MQNDRPRGVFLKFAYARAQRRGAAFTLIEAIATLVIVGILAGVAVVAYTSTRKGTSDQAGYPVLGAVQATVREMAASNSYKIPSTLTTDLTDKGVGGLRFTDAPSEAPSEELSKDYTVSVSTDPTMPQVAGYAVETTPGTCLMMVDRLQPDSEQTVSGGAASSPSAGVLPPGSSRSGASTLWFVAKPDFTGNCKIQLECVVSMQNSPGDGIGTADSPKVVTTTDCSDPGQGTVTPPSPSCLTVSVTGTVGSPSATIKWSRPSDTSLVTGYKVKRFLGTPAFASTSAGDPAVNMLPTTFATADPAFTPAVGPGVTVASTTPGFEGSSAYDLSVPATASNGQNLISSPLTNLAAAAASGTSITFSAWASRLSSATTPVAVQPVLYWYDNSGAALPGGLASTTGATTQLGAPWSRLLLTATVPTGAVKMVAAIKLDTATAPLVSGVHIGADAFTVETGATVSTPTIPASTDFTVADPTASSYVDSAVVSGQTYTYAVVSYNLTGGVTKESSVMELLTTQQSLPAVTMPSPAVTNLAGSQNATPGGSAAINLVRDERAKTVTISWTQPAGAGGYTVSRKVASATDSTYTDIASITDPGTISFVDSSPDLDWAVAYTYRVMSVATAQPSVWVCGNFHPDDPKGGTATTNVTVKTNPPLLYGTADSPYTTPPGAAVPTNNIWWTPSDVTKEWITGDQVELAYATTTAPGVLSPFQVCGADPAVGSTSRADCLYGSSATTVTPAAPLQHILTPGTDTATGKFDAAVSPGSVLYYKARTISTDPTAPANHIRSCWSDESYTAPATCTPVPGAAVKLVQPLAAPVVTATADNATGVSTVTWPSVSGANAYAVYKDTLSGPAPAAPTSATSFTGHYPGGGDRASLDLTYDGAVDTLQGSIVNNVFVPRAGGAIPGFNVTAVGGGTSFSATSTDGVSSTQMFSVVAYRTDTAVFSPSGAAPTDLHPGTKDNTCNVVDEYDTPLDATFVWTNVSPGADVTYGIFRDTDVTNRGVVATSAEPAAPLFMVGANTAFTTFNPPLTQTSSFVVRAKYSYTLGGPTFWSEAPSRGTCTHRVAPPIDLPPPTLNATGNYLTGVSTLTWFGVPKAQDIADPVAYAIYKDSTSAGEIPPGSKTEDKYPGQASFNAPIDLTFGGTVATLQGSIVNNVYVPRAAGQGGAVPGFNITTADGGVSFVATSTDGTPSKQTFYAIAYETGVVDPFNARRSGISNPAETNLTPTVNGLTCNVENPDDRPAEAMLSWATAGGVVAPSGTQLQYGVFAAADANNAAAAPLFTLTSPTSSKELLDANRLNTSTSYVVKVQYTYPGGATVWGTNTTSPTGVSNVATCTLTDPLPLPPPVPTATISPAGVSTVTWVAVRDSANLPATAYAVYKDTRNNAGAMPANSMVGNYPYNPVGGSNPTLDLTYGGTVGTLQGSIVNQNGTFTFVPRPGAQGGAVPGFTISSVNGGASFSATSTDGNPSSQIFSVVAYRVRNAVFSPLGSDDTVVVPQVANLVCSAPSPDGLARPATVNLTWTNVSGSGADIQYRLYKTTDQSNAVATATSGTSTIANQSISQDTAYVVKTAYNFPASAGTPFTPISPVTTPPNITNQANCNLLNPLEAPVVTATMNNRTGVSTVTWPAVPNANAYAVYKDTLTGTPETAPSPPSGFLARYPGTGVHSPIDLTFGNTTPMLLGSIENGTFKARPGTPVPNFTIASVNNGASFRALSTDGNPSSQEFSVIAYRTTDAVFSPPGSDRDAAYPEISDPVCTVPDPLQNPTAATISWTTPSGLSPQVYYGLFDPTTGVAIGDPTEPATPNIDVSLTATQTFNIKSHYTFPGTSGTSGWTTPTTPENGVGVASVTCETVPPLPTPQLTATITPQGVSTVTWPAVTNATAYAVYKDNLTASATPPDKSFGSTPAAGQGPTYPDTRLYTTPLDLTFGNTITNLQGTIVNGTFIPRPGGAISGFNIVSVNGGTSFAVTSTDGVPSKQTFHVIAYRTNVVANKITYPVQFSDEGVGPDGKNGVTTIMTPTMPTPTCNVVPTPTPQDQLPATANISWSAAIGTVVQYGLFESKDATRADAKPITTSTSLSTVWNISVTTSYVIRAEYTLGGTTQWSLPPESGRGVSAQFTCTVVRGPGLNVWAEFVDFDQNGLGSDYLLHIQPNPETGNGLTNITAYAVFPIDMVLFNGHKLKPHPNLTVLARGAGTAGGFTYLDTETGLDTGVVIPRENYVVINNPKTGPDITIGCNTAGHTAPGQDASMSNFCKKQVFWSKGVYFPHQNYVEAITVFGAQTSTAEAQPRAVPYASTPPAANPTAARTRVNTQNNGDWTFSQQFHPQLTWTVNNPTSDIYEWANEQPWALTGITYRTWNGRYTEGAQQNIATQYPSETAHNFPDIAGSDTWAYSVKYSTTTPTGEIDGTWAADAFTRPPPTAPVVDLVVDQVANRVVVNINPGAGAIPDRYLIYETNPAKISNLGPSPSELVAVLPAGGTQRLRQWADPYGGIGVTRNYLVVAQNLAPVDTRFADRRVGFSPPGFDHAVANGANLNYRTGAVDSGAYLRVNDGGFSATDPTYHGDPYYIEGSYSASGVQAYCMDLGRVTPRGFNFENAGVAQISGNVLPREYGNDYYVVNGQNYTNGIIPAEYIRTFKYILAAWGGRADGAIYGARSAVAMAVDVHTSAGVAGQAWLRHIGEQYTNTAAVRDIIALDTARQSGPYTVTTTDTASGQWTIVNSRILAQSTWGRTNKPVFLVPTQGWIPAPDSTPAAGTGAAKGLATFNVLKDYPAAGISYWTFVMGTPSPVTLNQADPAQRMLLAGLMETTTITTPPGTTRGFG